MNAIKDLYNIQAEEQLIGSVLINSDCFFEVDGIIEYSDFMKRTFQRVWQAFSSLSSRGVRIDLLTATTELERTAIDEEWQGVNWTAELAKTTSMTVSSMSAKYYAKEIKDLSQRREIVQAFNAAAEPVFDISRPVVGTIETLLTSIATISSTKEQQRTTATEAMLDFVSDLYAENTEIPVYSAAMKEFIGGFEPETLILVAGRPGMGKTAWMLWCACSQAMAGYKVNVHELEMSARQMWQRLLCGIVGISYQDIKLQKKNGGVSDATIEKFTKAVDQLTEKYKNNLVVFDRSGQTTDDIYLTTLREKPDIVYIDHLGLLADWQKGWTKNDKIGHVSWQCKRIAKDMHIPVVALSQLNRDVEKRQDKHPLLSDLRDSGELEQNADMVIGMYRDDYYTGIYTNQSDVDLQLLKNRNGALGRWKQVLNLSRQWFYEVTNQPVKAWNER